MIMEADHQGGWVMYPTALPAFLEMYRNLCVATKPTRTLVHESEINIIIIIIVSVEKLTSRKISVYQNTFYPRKDVCLS